MTTQTEALKLALEALELVVLRQKEAAGKQIDAPEITRLWSALTDCIPTITAIKEALAQPEQEPVIGTKTWFEDGKLVTQHLTEKDIRNLFSNNGQLDRDEVAMLLLQLVERIQNLERAPQRTWVGLTLEDKKEYVDQDFGGNRLDAMDWAEKRLKEKNTWQDGDCKHCVNGCPACDARRQSNVLS